MVYVRLCQTFVILLVVLFFERIGVSMTLWGFGHVVPGDVRRAGCASIAAWWCLSIAEVCVTGNSIASRNVGLSVKFIWLQRVSPGSGCSVQSLSGCLAMCVTFQLQSRRICAGTSCAWMPILGPSQDAINHNIQQDKSIKQSNWTVKQGCQVYQIADSKLRRNSIALPKWLRWTRQPFLSILRTDTLPGLFRHAMCLCPPNITKRRHQPWKMRMIQIQFSTFQPQFADQKRLLRVFGCHGCEGGLVAEERSSSG